MNIQEIKKNSIELLQKEISENDILFSHSVRTGLILQKIGLGEETISAGLLHHVSPEKLETGVIKTIVKKTNQLKELTEFKKTPKVRPIKQWEKSFLNQQSENLRRMFFAISRDLRPIFVTLAGRLDTMRNLTPERPKDQQIKEGLMALEILAPLAYGLGMGEMKGQLEDLAFPYVYPKEHKFILENVVDKYQERKGYLKEVKSITTDILTKEKIPFLNVHARAKHYFSLYQKMLRYNLDAEEIYDLVALRIIMPDIETCYKTLGIIHKKWPPLEGRIKDYISTPKPNGYRSLHTTIMCGQGKPVEFQIKTKEMHQEAEYGAAAHMAYEKKIPQKKYTQKFYWMEQIRQWREEEQDSKKIADYVGSELFKDKIFVFTPKGEVISLIKDSTPVDFAYAIHTEVGDHCESAKINDKMQSLNQKLKTGDTVEILINKNKTPSLDWLRFVKTHKAKAKIKNFFEQVQGLSFKEVKKQSSPIRKKVEAIKKILPLKKKVPVVLIGGVAGIQAKFSKCCKPKENDILQAFITKGEGASIHKADCGNLKELAEKWPQRIVQASWHKDD